MRLRTAVVAVVVAVVLSACGKEAPKFHSTDITGAEWGKGFELTDHHGKPRELADFRGKVVLVFFGFTNCPDMCPTAMAKMAAVVNHLGEDGKNVQGLFITLDPRRDTAEVLAQYVPAFHRSFLGLYADEATIAKTADDFKVFHRLTEPDKNGHYTVDHSGAIFAFDPQGRLRLYMVPHAPVEKMTEDVRQLLRDSS